MTQGSRIGLSLAPSKNISIDSLLDLARLADRLGYDSLWVPETWGADAVTLLALLSSVTTKIRLASGVLNVFSRSAALIAQTAATLQSHSGGRFILGLGTSGPVVVQNWHGSQFRRPIDRTRDYVAVIRKALAGQQVDYVGTEFSLSGFRLSNPPSQTIPIYLAALGPRNVRLTGEIADGWLPIFAPRGQLQRLVSDLRFGAEKASRDVSSIDVAAYLPCALGEQGTRALRQQLAYYVGGMGTFYFEHVVRAGFEREATQIRESWLRSERREAMDAVTDAMLERCTLGPDARTIAAQIAEYRREGLGLPVLVPPHGTSAEHIAATLEALAPGL